MNRRVITAHHWSMSILALLVLSPCRAEPLHAAEVRLNGHVFTLPDGFDIEQVAGPPLVDRPIVADFDEQGRLYVADSSGSNDKVDKQLADKPHRILRLEDTDGDGNFDKRTIFADRMMFPEGTMWLNGSLYVAAPPSIWKLTDTDGDGVADQRVEWFQGKTLTGCANDLHGPYAGPDGWIYWCKGAFAKQTYDRPGKPPFETRASHIFRCRPDGSGLEHVMTGGMDNPVDVVFTPGGERIFTTTFLQHPAGGKRDGLIHAVYGGVYGKVHDVIEDHKRTSSDVMPVLTHLGAAAPCGLTAYPSNVFGAGFQNNLFAALFNMQKITRHVLTPDGGSFTSLDSDFVVSDNKDFHPTDVLDDADGSLIVVDTGGWYKLCCPTSQLHKPDVLGAIYRVRRKRTTPPSDPRGLKINWSGQNAGDLGGLLGDPRPAVRTRAVQALSQLGAAALPALLEAANSSHSLDARRNAVWTAMRIDSAAARAIVRSGLSDSDAIVRQAALHGISLWRDRAALPALIEVLKGGSPQNQRAAAEALGRIGAPSAVPELLNAASRPSDRALEHSVVFALIETADPRAAAAGLESAHPLTRRAALVALDQMDGGGLTAAIVTPHLKSTDSAVREAALWVASRHPEWGADLAGFLRERLARKDFPAAERGELEGQLARFSRTATIQDLLASRLQDSAASRDERQTVLRAMAQSGLREIPKPWVAGLTSILAGTDPELVNQAVATARALPAPKEPAPDFASGLLKVAGNAVVPAGVRLDALAAIPGGLSGLPPELFAFLRSQLDPEQPVGLRTLTADVLAKSKLTAEQLAVLADALAVAGPLELDRLLAAFDQSSNPAIGVKVVTMLKQSSARSALRVETLKPRLARFGQPVQQSSEELFALLNMDTAKQKERLESLLSGLASGDVRRGQAVFNGKKALCATCHSIGYLGGKVGPDLTRIGQIRNERDLLEAIVFPNASFVRSFEPIVVVTKDGKTYSGVLKKDAADEVILVKGPNEELRFARSDIEEMQPGTVSTMPSGLDQQLSPQDLADLVTFLKACR